MLLQSSEWNQITGPSVTSSGRRWREGDGREGRRRGRGVGGGEREGASPLGEQRAGIALAARGGEEDLQRAPQPMWSGGDTASLGAAAARLATPGLFADPPKSSAT